MVSTSSGIVVPCLVGAMLVALVFVAVPSGTEAREYENWSPSFATDTTWSLDVGYCAAGEIIWWWWDSSDSLYFWLLRSPGSVQISGFYDWDGYLVEESASYSLVWYNNNLIFSAQVYYSVEVFTPSAATITKPQNNAFVNTFAVDLQGVFDTRADGVLVGPDALHLYKAATVGADWGFDDLGLNEGVNTVLVRTYYLLDYYGTKNHTIDRTVEVTVDITIPELNIVKPHINDYVAGMIDVSWLCSDNTGIAKREIRVDATDWVTVTTDSYTTQLEDGDHTVRVQVTDLAGNSIFTEVHVVSDTVAPQIAIAGPEMNAKMSEDSVAVSWTGSDALSGVDHYEVSLNGGEWTDVGTDTSYLLSGLEDKWHSVTIKAEDRSGNTAESTVSFGIYTSIWSANGPYSGIPLYALMAAIIAAAVIATLMVWRRKKAGVPPPEKRP